MRKTSIPLETIIELRQRLERWPKRSPQRRTLIKDTAELYGVSPETVYRNLRHHTLPHSVRRTDYGQTRVMPKQDLLRYCEIIAALKVRTSNNQGRHLSTVQAIRLLEEHGLNTDNGHLQAPPELLKKTTVNRYLKQWGYDKEKLSRQPPAVRFEAEYSNQCWHFDLSSSDLKRLKNSVELEPGRGKPLLMLYSVVDDRSGVSYQEYHEVYGEDTGAALKFLFNAMSAKTTESFPFQGIPSMLYMDNGPIGRSQVFQKVMNYLGIEVRTHVPKGKDGRRVTARAKGFETTSQKHLAKELKAAISQGRLIALSGVVGSGKTTFLQKLMADLIKSKEVVVSRSLAVESDKVRLVTLITALFYDLSSDKVEKVPSNSEKRERLLLELIKKARSPVALFVDDAHGLHSTTLVSLKKLIELVRSNGERLSVILAGHPKLKNDLRRPTLEEIGGRTQAFALQGIRGHQSEYINWLLTLATFEKVQPTDILEAETIDYLSQRLSTPLQIEQYLTLAMNEAYQVGLKPITIDFMETVLAIGLDDLEPNLIRHGYNVRSIARLLNVKPAEVRSFLYNQLPPEKIQDMRDQILKIGIPL